MSATWNQAKRDGFGLNASELFNVVLVYEDQASALRGLALYRRLVAELGEDREFSLNVWKFALLGVSRLAELSASQAAEADLIILCPRGEAEPPALVQAWFQRWVEMKGRHHCALVVLGETTDSPPALSGSGRFFQGLARHGRVSVFPPPAGCNATATDERDWRPRRPHSLGVGGWFQEDRRLQPPCPTQLPSAQN